MWSVSAMGWERGSGFSGHWAHNQRMKEETEFSLHAESWPPAHTEDRDSGSDFSAHIVLIWISCVQVDTAFKKLKICLSLDSIPSN